MVPEEVSAVSEEENGALYRHYTDCIDGLMLDLYANQYTEVRSRWEEKIARGEIHPRLFVISPVSPNARKYNFKVCKRYQEEEKMFVNTLEKSLQLNENRCIKIDLCIWDLSIAQRFRWRNRNQCILLYKRKFQKLQATVMIYTKRADDSETRLKDCVVV